MRVPAYADNIVLVAPTLNTLQLVLDALKGLCMDNGIISKTKIMHFRKKGCPLSTVNFVYSTHRMLQ